MDIVRIDSAKTHIFRLLHLILSLADLTFRLLQFLNERSPE
jgi:hypothetical protein